MELNGIEEVAPLTDEQWERIIRWYRKRSGRKVVEAILAAKDFHTSMNTILTLAGSAQAQLDEVSQALLNMAEGEVTDTGA